MSQANAKHRHIAMQLAHQFKRHARLTRRAGPRRQHNRRWLERPRLRHIDRIVTHHQRRLPQPLKIASQVVDEAVVVIDREVALAENGLDNGCGDNRYIVRSLSPTSHRH